MAIKDLDLDTKLMYLSAKEIVGHLKSKYPDKYLLVVPKKISKDNPKEYIRALKSLYDLDKSLFEKVVGSAADLIPEKSNNSLGFSRSLFFETVHKITSIWAVNNGFRL